MALKFILLGVVSSLLLCSCGGEHYEQILPGSVAKVNVGSASWIRTALHEGGWSFRYDIPNSRDWIVLTRIPLSKFDSKNEPGIADEFFRDLRLHVDGRISGEPVGKFLSDLGSLRVFEYISDPGYVNFVTFFETKDGYVTFIGFSLMDKAEFTVAIGDYISLMLKSGLIREK